MEVYRSGHNGPDSKSGSPPGLVGSNPTASVSKVLKMPCFCGFSALFSNEFSDILRGKSVLGNHIFFLFASDDYLNQSQVPHLLRDIEYSSLFEIKQVTDFLNIVTSG